MEIYKDLSSPENKQFEKLLNSQLSKNIIEEGKISIRNIRRDSIHQLIHKGKEDNVSEDLIKDNQGEIQTLTDKNNT